MRNSRKSAAPASAQARSVRAESAERGACTDAYYRHVGRYGSSLAAQMMRLAAVTQGQRAIDVGCGPGALARVLAGALGPENVAAVDPHEPFVKACRGQVPGAEVVLGAAEALPFAEERFEAMLAQLVLDVVEDPRRAVAEMLRVLRPGGVIAASV